jgi:two-component system nitrogen regulation response regulator GlnG
MDWEKTETRPGRPWSVPCSPAWVTGLTILAHPDASRVGERAVLRGLTEREAHLSRLEPLFTTPYGGEPRALADPYLSRRPVVLSRDAGGIRIDCRQTSTRVVANGEIVHELRTFDETELGCGVLVLLAESVLVLLHRTLDATARGPHPTLVGASPDLLTLQEEIRRIADLTVPVLLQGETGTGKELVARAIHEAGPRRDRPYVAVNMAAIPPTLAATELFGAARGAYTGAERRRFGLFQRADGGSLLLDEIGETPAEVQVMLLRVLETGIVEMVGEGTPQTVDVRILAATDVDLESATTRGDFRAPLLHRLSAYEITLPPLRERREDFGRLFYHFLREELEAIGETHRLERPPRGARPWLPAALVARMAELAWPGNVRQLRNVTRQLVIASRGHDQVQIGPRIERLLNEADEPLSEEETAGATERRWRRTYRDPQDVSDDELLEVLRANHWRLKPTALALGISRTSLYALVERCPRVRQAKDLSRQEVESALRGCGGHLDCMSHRLEVSRDALLRRLKQLGLR